MLDSLGIPKSTPYLWCSCQRVIAVAFHFSIVKPVFFFQPSPYRYGVFAHSYVSILVVVSQLFNDIGIEF